MDDESGESTEAMEKVPLEKLDVVTKRRARVFVLTADGSTTRGHEMTKTNIFTVKKREFRS